MSLTPEQREEYREALAGGVPEDVIAEFIERLDRAEERWKAALRRAIARGDRFTILRDDDLDA
jgi:hypothetical protein